MTMPRRSWLSVTVLAGLLLAGAGGFTRLQAQALEPLPPGGGAGPALGQGEIQRLFDAYVAMQAQEQLGLDDDQYGRFLPRLKALQEARRRADVERTRLVAELGRGLRGGAMDDHRIRTQLKMLDEQELRAHSDVRAAYDAVMATLDVRRQARFRVLELQMERRKLDLVLRARRPAAGVPRRQRD